MQNISLAKRKCYTTLHHLMIFARYGAKICNFWTFRPVIQLTKHLFKIRQKPFCPRLHWAQGSVHYLREGELVTFGSAKREGL